MNRPTWSRLGSLLGCLAMLILLGFSPWGLWERDEGRYADVAREMLARHDFITPRIDGTVFLDKPPLVYWVTAASLKVWGAGETGARFGQLLFAVGILLVTRRIGTLLFGKPRGDTSVLILASSIGFFAACHILTLDLALTFFVSLALLFFLEGRTGGSGGRRAYLGMFAAGAGGALSKGPIGVLLPALAIGCFLILRRDWRRLTTLPWISGGGLFLALVLPWYVAVSIKNPEFPGYFFVHEHLERFSTTVHRHQGGWYYYLAILALGFLPWSLLVPLAASWRRDRPPDPGAGSEAASAFLWSWTVPALLFFTASRSKLPLYALPMFPPVALLLGRALDRGLRRHASRIAVLWPATAVVGAGALLALLRRRPHAFEVLGAPPAPLRTGLLIVAPALAGIVLASVLVARGRLGAGLVAACLPLMLSGFATLDVVGGIGYLNETKSFAQTIRSETTGGERVYFYKCYLRGLPFYMGRTIGLVDPHADDLRLGRVIGHDEDSFVGEPDFLETLRGAARIFVVLRHEDLAPLQERLGTPLFVLNRSETLNLVSNRLGPGRTRDLAAILRATRFDLDAALDRLSRAVPASSVDLIEIERLSGEPTCTVHLSRGRSGFEASLAMGRPDTVRVSPSSPALEAAEDSDHVLRLVPPRGPLAGIGRLILQAAAG